MEQGLVDQREREVGVNFCGILWDQLFLVNLMVLITNLTGDRAGEAAFDQKNAQNRPKYAHFISQERLVV